MFNKIKFCLWLAVGLAGIALAAPFQGTAATINRPSDDLELPDVVARINGAPISSKFIKFRFDSVVTQRKRKMAQNPRPISINEKIAIIRDIIDKEVDRELLFQAAKAENIKANPKEIEEEFKKLKAMFEDDKAFNKNLEHRGITIKTLKDNLEEDFLIRELIEGRVRGKVSISEEEVKKFYDQNSKRFVRPESFRSRHILIPHYTRDLLKDVPKKDWKKKQLELSKQAEAKTEKILAEIRSGAGFEEMAKKYSQDAGSAEKGGDLGFMYKGVFDPEFDKAISKLKPNEISGVVKTQYGYHILQLLETRPSDVAPFADVKESLQRYLFMQKGQKSLQKYVDGLKKKG
ncbi:MAG: peptidylprolyl isomerase [Nitrospinales bacterium]